VAEARAKLERRQIKLITLLNRRKAPNTEVVNNTEEVERGNMLITRK